MIRTIFFYLVFAIFAILFFPISFICLYIIPQRRLARFIGLVWCEFTLCICRKILKLDYRFEGFDKIKEPSLIISKHQSTWEIPALFTEFNGKVTFIIKKELLRWPIFGRLFKNAGMIIIDRNNPILALRDMVNMSKKELENGNHILIFPEGTRTLPEDEEVRYKEGAYTLYSRLDVPAAGLALNSGCFWPRLGFIKKSGMIKAKVVRVVNPGLKKEVFEQKIIDAIEHESKVLAHAYIHRKGHKTA